MSLIRQAYNDGPSDRRVAPFGYLRISPCQPVPAAFRRLPRPSSPVEAKASPRCPFAALVRYRTVALYSLVFYFCDLTTLASHEAFFPIDQRTLFRLPPCGKKQNGVQSPTISILHYYVASYLPGQVNSKKEMFQPHLPVRLPCYDLALIARFTLEGL